jgi:hypothetical protein
MSDQALYVYFFGSQANEVSRHRLRWKGRVCRLLRRGAMGSVLIEFVDNGERLCCSLNALRRERNR